MADDDWIPLDEGEWVILVVQNEDPSERFVGPMTRAEANAWVDDRVAEGADWQRLVVAPLERPDSA